MMIGISVVKINMIMMMARDIMSLATTIACIFGCMCSHLLSSASGLSPTRGSPIVTPLTPTVPNF
jgi:hypothetical protein